MVANNQPNNNREQSGGLRVLIGLFKFILLLAVLAVGGLLGWLGWQQFNIQREFHNAQQKEIDSLQDDILYESDVIDVVDDRVSTRTDGFLSAFASVEDQISAVRDEVSGMEGQGAALQATLDAQAAEMAELANTIVQQADIQTEMSLALTALDADIASVSDMADQMQQQLRQSGSSQSLDELRQTLSSLQRQLSDLRTDLVELDARIPTTGTVSTAPAEPSNNPVVTAPVVVSSAPAFDYRIVRLHGLIIRAKIHINEGDIDSAASALESAQAAVADLSDTTAADVVASLDVVAANIDSAVENLGDKPTLSNLALDDAWTAMDELLLSLSGN